MTLILLDHLIKVYTNTESILRPGNPRSNHEFRLYERNARSHKLANVSYLNAVHELT